MIAFSLEHPVPWTHVFGDGRPVEVEIGPGRGERLLAAARACPAVNFFAIELRGGAAAAIADRAARLGIRNLRIVAGDVRWIIRLVADASVSAYHVHFPDPWPKTRHRERRLATPSFAREIARTLAPGGAVHVASDLPPVVEAFARALGAAGLVPLPGAVPPGDRPKSSFEQRYARGGTAYARFVRDSGRTGAPAPDEAI
jgi:tRNA (guanine-N7-)-methyltransferase